MNKSQQNLLKQAEKIIEVYSRKKKVTSSGVKWVLLAGGIVIFSIITTIVYTKLLI